MDRWQVAKVLHFEEADFLRAGLGHFGFHLSDGRYVAIAHPRHVLGFVEPDGTLAWTAGVAPVESGVPHIPAALDYPMYAAELPDGSLLVSNFGAPILVRIDPERRAASTFVDGRRLGMTDMGNCVLGQDGDLWINEVTGCRVWRFDAAGRVLEVLGDRAGGDLTRDAPFEEVRFAWIYDIRRGPEGRIYVLDSRHFALRAIDPAARRVVVIAGTGVPGFSGDGGVADAATFGGDPGAQFDGPISLALDERGNAFVGDRYNHRVRMVEAGTGTIETIAGRPDADPGRPNDRAERDPLRLNLPQISSLDYADGRLYVPTDLESGGDLAVLERG